MSELACESRLLFVNPPKSVCYQAKVLLSELFFLSLHDVWHILKEDISPTMCWRRNEGGAYPPFAFPTMSKKNSNFLTCGYRLVKKMENLLPIRLILPQNKLLPTPMPRANL